MAKAPLTRYALLLDDGALRAVERLQGAYDLKTKADVYQLAIRVLTWATEQKANGYEFGRYKDTEFQPLNLVHEPDTQVWKDSKTNGSAVAA